MEIKDKGVFIKPNGEVAVIKGSDNVFRDFGHPDAETLQLKAQLASQFIAVLNKRRLKGKNAVDILIMQRPIFHVYEIPIWPASPSTAWLKCSIAYRCMSKSK